MLITKAHSALTTDDVMVILTDSGKHLKRHAEHRLGDSPREGFAMLSHLAVVEEFTDFGINPGFISLYKKQSEVIDIDFPQKALSISGFLISLSSPSFLQQVRCLTLLTNIVLYDCCSPPSKAPRSHMPTHTTVLDLFTSATRRATSFEAAPT